MKKLLERWKKFKLLNERINTLDPDTGKRFINDALTEIGDQDNEIGISDDELSKIKRLAGLEGDPGFLGSASMGAAYKFGEKVLKITTDPDEAAAAALIVGKDHPNVYNVTFVARRSPSDRQRGLPRMPYIIVYDFLDYPTRAMADVTQAVYIRAVRGKKKYFYNWKPGYFEEALRLYHRVGSEISKNPEILGDPIGKWKEIWPKLEHLVEELKMSEKERQLFIEFWLVTHGSMSYEFLDNVENALEALQEVIFNPQNKYMHQLALGLTFLKNNGIIFNDLKSSNVMEKGGEIAIIDIGKATIIKDIAIQTI